MHPIEAKEALETHRGIQSLEQGLKDHRACQEFHPVFEIQVMSLSDGDWGWQRHGICLPREQIAALFEEAIAKAKAALATYGVEYDPNFDLR